MGNANAKTTKEFVDSLEAQDWDNALNLITKGDGEGGFVDVNAVLENEQGKKYSVLASFFLHSKGTTQQQQVKLLELILFGPSSSSASAIVLTEKEKHQHRPLCDIFDLQIGTKQTRPGKTAFVALLLNDELSSSASLSESLAPYIELLLEAADILPSPQNRNDPSFWRNHGGKWRNDKDLFVWNEIVVHLLDHHHRDSGIFELLLENDLIKSDRQLGELFSVLATKKHSGITLQNILSSGKFPKCLRNENISPEVLGITTAAPLYAAVVTGNAEYVKELVVNKVGGDLRSGGLVNDRRTYLSKDPLLDENPILSLEALKGGDWVWRRGFGFTSVNLLHFAAGSTASSSSDPFDEILTLLITMPGSGEFKNAVAPFIIQTRRSDFSKDEIHVTPAMLALIQGHESRAKILIANGGDQLPPGLHSKFSSLEQWFEDFKASDAGARLRIVKQMYS